MALLRPNRPQFPRAKINGTPDGVTSVHIGVRPRAGPEKSQKVNAEPSKAAPKGKSKYREERRAQRETRDWTTRRAGYGEVHSDVQDGSSTAGSNHSDTTFAQEDKRERSIPQPPPAERQRDKHSTPAGQQRALPRMTLEQAMAQWEKDHPNATPTSLSGGQVTDRVAAGPAEDWESSGDGPAHDGIYTYDYSGTSNATAATRGSACSTGTSSSTSTESQGNVLHVDGTEGPVRIYPPPPKHENAYGVPFGKRLKALVHMRKEAEASGLVPLSARKDGRMTSPREGNRTSGLARRPAVTSRESLFGHAEIHSKPRGRDPGIEEKNNSRQDRLRIERASPVNSARIESSDSTPTQSPSRRNDITPPQTRSTNPQERRRHSPSAALIPSLGPVTPSSRSEPPASNADGRPRRKPVSTYIGGDRTLQGLVTSGPASIRKQRSESDVKKDELTKEHRRREGKRNSPEKMSVQPSLLRQIDRWILLHQTG